MTLHMGFTLIWHAKNALYIFIYLACLLLVQSIYIFFFFLVPTVQREALCHLAQLDKAIENFPVSPTWIS